MNGREYITVEQLQQRVAELEGVVNAAREVVRVWKEADDINIGYDWMFAQLEDKLTALDEPK